MSELLVWANEDKEGDLNVKRGDVVEVRANDAPYGDLEGLPGYIIIKCPELLLEDIEGYQKAWNLELDHEVVNHNSALDEYRVRLFSISESVLGLGGITRTQVENYLSRWNASVFSASQNEVVFDIGIFSAIQSQAFWDNRENVDQIVFSEVYDEGTGIHTITADYSALNINSTYVERFVRGKADFIISHLGHEIVFTMDRNNVFSELREDIRERLARIEIRRRQYYFGSGVVNNVISQGGVVTITQAELNQYIRNKLDN